MDTWICEWVWPNGKSKIHVFNTQGAAAVWASKAYEQKIMAKVWRM